MGVNKGWSANRVLLVVGLCLAVGYPLFQYWMLRCQAVRGMVVDRNTGAPIAGAEVQKAGEGPFLLTVEAHVHAFGATASQRTDSEGRFRFPAKCAAGNILDFLLPVQWINSLSLSVYTPDHITSQVREDVWRMPGSVRYAPEGDGWYAYRTQYAVFKRNSLFLRGYEYRIELQKPRDEEEWQEKCRVTQQAMCFDQETQDRWIFNDLTSYWMRYPRSYFEPHLIYGFHDFGPYQQWDEHGVSAFDCLRFRRSPTDVQADFLKRFDAIGDALLGRIDLLKTAPIGFDIIFVNVRGLPSGAAAARAGELVAREIKEAEAAYRTWETEKEQIAKCAGRVK